MQVDVIAQTTVGHHVHGGMHTAGTALHTCLGREGHLIAVAADIGSARLIHILPLAHGHLGYEVIGVCHITLTVDVHHAREEFLGRQILIAPSEHAVAFRHCHLCYLRSPLLPHHTDGVGAGE